MFNGVNKRRKIRQYAVTIKTNNENFNVLNLKRSTVLFVTSSLGTYLSPIAIKYFPFLSFIFHKVCSIAGQPPYLLLLPEVDVGAAVEQEDGNLRVVVGDGRVQKRQAVAVQDVDVGAIWGRCYDHNFRRKNLACFLKNICYDQNFAKSSCSLGKKMPFFTPNIFAKIFLKS
jgi:hypothetical protein